MIAIKTYTFNIMFNTICVYAIMRAAKKTQLELFLNVMNCKNLEIFTLFEIQLLDSTCL